MLEAPESYASAIVGFFAGNDFTLVFSRHRPAVAPGGATVAVLEPAAILHMSRQTAKDLSLLMQDQIKRHEAESGAIETEFSRRAAAAEKAASKK